MEYFSIKEVAKICHCSTETIRRYIRTGKISKPFYGVGYSSGIIEMDSKFARAGYLFTEEQIDEIRALLKHSQSGEALRDGYLQWVKYGRREAEKKRAKVAFSSGI